MTQPYTSRPERRVLNRRVTIPPQTLRALQAGDVEAFEFVLSAYERPIFGFILRMVNHREVAEDLTQDTFLKVYRAAHRYDPDQVFATWIFTIARRTVYDWLRRQRHATDELKDPEALPEPQSGLALVRDRIDIARGLSTLRPEYRSVLIFYYWQGFSYDEIAQITEEPLNTVKTHLHRAKRALRHSLDAV